MNKEYNVDSPRASRDSYNKPIPLPNGNSECPYKLCRDCHRRRRTCEARLTEKRKRGLGKLRSREKGTKRA